MNKVKQCAKNFWMAVDDGYKRSIYFSGRSTRTQYWYFTLYVYLANKLVTYIDSLMDDHTVNFIFLISVTIPHVSVGVRRLHDINQSGWWVAGWLAIFSALIIVYPKYQSFQNVFIAVGGCVVLLGLIGLALYGFCTKGTAGENRFGPDPLA